MLMISSRLGEFSMRTNGDVDENGKNPFCGVFDENLSDTSIGLYNDIGQIKSRTPQERPRKRDPARI